MYPAKVVTKLADSIDKNHIVLIMVPFSPKISDKLNLLFYDGFEKIVSRKSVQKMTDIEIEKLVHIYIYIICKILLYIINT